VPNDSGGANPQLPALRFAAMLKAARDFGLDQGVVNAIALTFDPRRPNLAQIAEALAEALLACRPLEVLDSP
jgi:hypothetical protein